MLSRPIQRPGRVYPVLLAGLAIVGVFWAVEARSVEAIAQTFADGYATLLLQGAQGLASCF